MPRPTFTRRAVLAAGAFVLAAPRVAAQTRPLTVFAAASLQTVLTSIAAEWRKDGDRRVTFSFAATSSLARQLEQGAPADLFASADIEWMDWAQQRNLVRPETRRQMLGNTLVLVARAEDAIDLPLVPGVPLAQAIGDSRLATGNPQSVPVGRYAQAALTSLGVWEQVRPRLAGVDNVRVAASLVVRGEARFAILYATDAKPEPRLRVVGTFPPGSHPPIVYPFAVTRASTHPDALAFLDYLSSPPARRLFEADGFAVL